MTCKTTTNTTTAKTDTPDEARTSARDKEARCALPIRAAAIARRKKVLALLRRRNGVRIKELVEFTGWQPHSVRAYLSCLRRQGLVITHQRHPAPARYKLEEQA